MVSGRPHAVERRERVHDRDHICRCELGLNEVDQRLTQAYVVPAADVIVIQEDRKHPDIFTGGLPLYVECVADRPRRLGAGLRNAGDANQPKRLDGLGGAVLEHLEVVRLQVGHGVAFPVGDDDIDADEVDVCPEDGWLLLLLRRLLRLGRLWLLLLLLRLLLLSLSTCGKQRNERQQEERGRLTSPTDHHAALHRFTPDPLSDRRQTEGAL